MYNIHLLARDFHGSRWSPRTRRVRNRVELLSVFFSHFIFYSQIRHRLIFAFLRPLQLIPRYRYTINRCRYNTYIISTKSAEVAGPRSDGISLSSVPDDDQVSNMKCNDCERRSRRWRRRSVTKRKRSNSRATTIGRRQSRHTGKSRCLRVVLSMVFFRRLE